MRYRDAFPRRTETVDAWIPTRDGTRLHARIQLPVDALDDPVPALLEYLPYRKDDWTAPRDAARHPWYAGHGYASVRVDVRGTGDSEGLLLDEYTPAELADGVDVVGWLAAQPWCTGRVGMFGISWGGFNALQVAALAPDALRAVVTVCSTDDRYDNDVHYTGGAVLGIDMAGWSGTMLAFTARPPDPAVVGERWLPMWRERLEAAEPFLHRWLAHPERDDYWRHGSVCEDPSAIRAAVLAVGGWNDPYRDTVLRLLSTLDAPVRGIVGPWAHRYPDIELPPGPAIGFLQETLRWWDRWLKDEPTGVEDDPPLRAWIQEPVRPATTYPERPGRWVGTPVVGETTHELALGTGSEPVVVAAPDHTGIDAGRYFPFGNPTDLPPDQRAEDGRSVCFDLGPLPERVEILGRPVVRLRLDADRPAAAVVVRLCTVDDDGASTLVTPGRAEPDPPPRPRPHRAVDPGRPRDGRGSADGDRLGRPRRRAAAGRGLADVLAVGVAAPRAGTPDGRARPELADPAAEHRHRPPGGDVRPARAGAAAAGDDHPAAGPSRTRGAPRRRHRHLGAARRPPLRRLTHLPRRSVLRRGHPRDLPDHRRRPALGARRVGLDDRDRPRRLADRRRDPLGAHRDRHRLRRRQLAGRPARR
jgi:putative CocE/NonD family hydrolase